MKNIPPQIYLILEDGTTFSPCGGGVLITKDEKGMAKVDQGDENFLPAVKGARIATADLLDLLRLANRVFGNCFADPADLRALEARTRAIMGNKTKTKLIQEALDG